MTSHLSCLVVLAHPSPTSLCHVLAADAVSASTASGLNSSLIDLYDEDYDPRLTQAERASYYSSHFQGDENLVYAQQLLRCKRLVLVFPVWWYGLPAILKGYLDRTLAPGIAFDHRPNHGRPRPLLVNLESVFILTTLNASWWGDRLHMRHPVKKMIKTSMIRTCAPRAKTSYLPLYQADRANEQKIEAYRSRIRKSLAKK